MMSDCNKAVLLIIDVQQKLFPVMSHSDDLKIALTKLTKGIKTLEIPILLTEQYPEGLGPTIPELRDLIPDVNAILKRSFSCCQSDDFISALQRLKRKQVIVCGIEAHICVWQTCMDLIMNGYDVFLVADAISSRNTFDKELTLRVLEKEGVHLRSVEMLLFELLQTSLHEKFKTISRIIK